MNYGKQQNSIVKETEESQVGMQQNQSFDFDMMSFLTSIINSLTRFHPDFHHVGGEIKSGCDYKKSVQRRLTPHLFFYL